MAVTTQQVAELYVATFNRAPDAAGLAYWISDGTSATTTLTDINAIARAMQAGAEAETGVGSMTNTEYVISLYSSMFGRTVTAADAGVTYWVDQMTAGSVDRANLIQTLIEGAQASTGSATDAAMLANKTTVGLAFAAAGLNNVTDATSVLSGVTADAATVTAAQTSIDHLVSPVQALTTSADTILGTVHNDTITGTFATIAAGDLILDTSSTDNDTFTMTLTAQNAALRVTGIENVNADWNAYGTAGIDATNITGATITGTSSKVGFLGSMTVTAAGANTVVAGSGMIGTMTVNGITAGTVEGGVARTIVAASANTAAATDTVVINAGTSTTSVTATDFKTMTVDAGTATTISLTDTATGVKTALDTANVTFGADVTLNNDVDVLTLTGSAADKTVTLVNTAAGVKSIDVAGTNNVTISVADASAAINTQMTAITKSSTGTLTYKTGATTTGAANLTGIAADSFVFTSTVGNVMTVNSGANVTLQANGGAATAFATGAGTADTLTLNLSTNQTALIATSTETTTINIAADAVTNAADVTLTAVNAGTNTVVLNTANDIAATLTAATVDATGVTADLTLNQTAGETGVNMTMSGGSAINTVGFTATTANSNYVGQDARDVVTFANTTGSATAVVGNGNNSITANGVTLGDLVVIAGSGNDTVSATALVSTSAGTTDDAANVTLDLGNGNNTATLTITAGATGGAGAVNHGANVVVTTGSGTDSVVLTATTTAYDNINLTLGDGTDTLTLKGGSANLTLGTVTATGLDVIKIDDTAADGATVNATLVSGKTMTFTSANTDGLNDDVLTIVNTATTASTVDLRGLTLDRTVDTGVASTVITGSNSAVAETIYGTAFADAITAQAGTNTIYGGAGKDTLVGGAGTDTYVFASGDSGLTTATVDTITTAFTSGTDKLNFGLAGSATNYTEAASTFDSANAGGDTNATVAQVLAQANAILDGTVRYAVVDNANANTGGVAIAATASYVFFDADGDGSADMAVQVVGALTGIAYTDLIA